MGWEHNFFDFSSMANCVDRRGGVGVDVDENVIYWFPKEFGLKVVD